MPNWYKRLQQSRPSQETQRFRVMVPIDINIPPQEDEFKNQEYVYGTLKTMFDIGQEHIKELHRGINVMLDFNDIKPYSELG